LETNQKLERDNADLTKTVEEYKNSVSQISPAKQEDGDVKNLIEENKNLQEKLKQSNAKTRKYVQKKLSTIKFDLSNRENENSDLNEKLKVFEIKSQELSKMVDEKNSEIENLKEINRRHEQSIVDKENLLAQQESQIANINELLLQKNDTINKMQEDIKEHIKAKNIYDEDKKKKSLCRFI